MDHAEHRAERARHARAQRYVASALVAVVVLYLLALAAGKPQAATDRMIDAEAHAVAPLEHGAVVALEPGHRPPPLYAVLPFASLLAAIAVLPLMPATAHWWEHNRNRLLVSVALAAVVLVYYLVMHAGTVDRHFLGHAVTPAAAQGLSWSLVNTVLQNSILGEYVPFIVLLFSLYTIAGGIRVDGDLAAHPITNTSMIAIGGVLASLIGTTGAAMLLVRPLLDTNRERKHVAHTVVFFIFVVCNCGGCLTPLGDPPLFLGYLQGVPFFWTLRLWPAWLLVNGLLLASYYIWDRFVAYPREAPADIARDETQTSRLRFSGVVLNVTLLGLLVVAVAMLDPSMPLAGTNWHPWIYLRETVLLTLSALSLGLGAVTIRMANRFSFAPMIEVAALFLGIFICMQPALQILDANGATLGIDTALKFFWTTGSLSAVLDNAPTYLVFFETAKSLPSPGGPLVAGVQEPHLVAISLGAVFMGAMTYIGNGPNFMVKAVAEANGIKMPSFFSYLLYSCAILLPILMLTSLLCI